MDTFTLLPTQAACSSGGPSHSSLAAGSNHFATVPFSDMPAAGNVSDVMHHCGKQAPQPKAACKDKGNNNGKAVEARVAASGSPWRRFPSLASAQNCTGIPRDDIKILASTHEDHMGWEFRWPPAPEHPKEADQQPTEANVESVDVLACDIDDLVKRIRAVPSAARPRLLSALPETTRTALKQYMRSPPASPNISPAAPSTNLNTVLSNLPDLLRRVPQEARCKVLEGVRHLGSRYQAMLLAPDIATVATLLREVVPAQRRALLEALSPETQQSLQEHMLAAKANADCVQATASVTPIVGTGSV